MSLEISESMTEDFDSRFNNQPLRHISALSFISKYNKDNKNEIEQYSDIKSKKIIF